MDPRAQVQAEAEKTFDQFIVWTKRTCLAFGLFGAVVVALLLTTRRALKSDLAMVLKG